MHVRAIDAPSDRYGTVTDVSRPLIYKLNQASIQRGTYDALHALLVWALATLEGGTSDSLHVHEKHNGIVPTVATPVLENRPPQSTQDARTEAPEGGSGSEGVKSLVAPANASVNDATPLSLELLGESAEDTALEAEAAAAVVPSEAPAPAPSAKRTPKPV